MAKSVKKQLTKSTYTYVKKSTLKQGVVPKSKPNKK
jgi:hypothetical protein